MSTEENSNTIEPISLLNSITNQNEKNTNSTPETLKSQTNLITNEQKIKQLKQKLKSLLQKHLGKSLLILESNNQNQLQILTTTTKIYNEFNDKINLMKNQVEENLKKKEENQKIKKIKVSKAKFRSRTIQKGNINTYNTYKKDSIKTLNNENNKSLTNIRAKTEGKNNKNNKIQYSEKKPIKHIKLDSNNKELNSTLKLNTHKKSFSKYSLTEYNTYNNSVKASKKNIKERKDSKDIKPIEKKKNSRTKINVIHKNQYDLKSSSNLLSDSKNKTEKDKINNTNTNNNNKKISTRKKNFNIDYRKSFDYSNRKIPKPKINNYVKKNTEIFSEKKISQKKNYVNKKKENLKETQKDEKINKEEDTDMLISRFEKQKKLLEKIRKQREEDTLREEERKKEFEKYQEEERKRAEEREKRELEIKRREEQRKKELEEEQRKKDEERRKRQLEIEAKIEKEKIEKENIKKELMELERQKKLEEEIKRDEIEKLKIEMDKINEQEEVKELPKNMELNIYNNKDENKNKEMNIQDLLELEEKNEQNFEYFHIKEEIEKDSLLVTPEEKKEQDIEIKNNDIKKNNTENIIKEEPKISYRKISILELIHDASNFSPILFEFLTLKEKLEFTAISKKIKRQRINIFNLQKIKILTNIGFEDEQSLDKKIKEYEENYSNNELNEPFIEYHLSRGAEKAIQLLNKNTYSKIFRRPVLDNNLSQIYIAYRILFIFFDEIEIANISDDKLFWIKCTEYLNTKSEEGKIGDFILSKFENYNCDSKTVYYIEKIMEGKKDNMSPSYFSKICGSTGLLIFLIKELMEYCGVIISTKKTQLSRVYQNLIFFKKLVNKLSEFNKTLENFNY